MRHLRYIFLIISIIVLTQAGKYSSDFLELGVSGRNLAMGSSCSALDRSNTAFYSNPAGIAFTDKSNANLMYMDQFGLAKYNYIGSSYSINKTTKIAVNWIHFGVTDIPRRPDLFLSGEYTSEERKAEILSKKGQGYGSFSNSEDALYFSFAQMHRHDIFLSWMYHNLKIYLPIGGNIKLIRKHLDDAHGYGIGADFGARMYFSFGEFMSNKAGSVSLGVTFQDFTNTTIYWDTDHADNFDSNIKLSVAYDQPLKIFQSEISISWEKNTRYENDYRYGIEYLLKDKVALRAGHNFNGLNYGCGLKTNIFGWSTTIDYAFLKHDLGNCHRIGLGLWF